MKVLIALVIIFIIYKNMDYFKYMWKTYLFSNSPVSVQPSFCFDCNDDRCSDCMARISFEKNGDLDKAWELFVAEKKYKVDIAK